MRGVREITGASGRVCPSCGPSSASTRRRSSGSAGTAPRLAVVPRRRDIAPCRAAQGGLRYATDLVEPPLTPVQRAKAQKRSRRPSSDWRRGSHSRPASAQENACSILGE